MGTSKIDSMYGLKSPFQKAKYGYENSPQSVRYELLTDDFEYKIVLAKAEISLWSLQMSGSSRRKKVNE